MRKSAAIFALLAASPLHAGTIFNVGYDPTGLPQLSGEGGTLPPPPGLPSLSNLIPNAPNLSHTLPGGGTLWIDNYTSGDYFSFDILGVDPADRIALTGLWFATSSSATGPTNVSVEMISLGGTSETVHSGAPGIYVLSPSGIVSDTPVVQLRFVATGGVDDFRAPHETFGIDFISATFEVIPEPSASLLGLAAIACVTARRKR